MNNKKMKEATRRKEKGEGRINASQNLHKDLKTVYKSSNRCLNFNKESDTCIGSDDLEKIFLHRSTELK